LYFTPKYGPTKELQSRTGDENGDDQKDDVPTKALNIIFESKRRGIYSDKDYATPYNWLFYSVPYGTPSQCSDDPVPATVARAAVRVYLNLPMSFPAGTYDVKTQDGDCQYKNDGKGNAGALWCNDVVHPCRANVDKDKRFTCDDLREKTGWPYIEHVPVGVCEW
jgi:hypothetical protein